MKKRIFAFIMCVVLCMTLCIPAYATESSTTSILNIGGVDYAYTREKSAREITVTMENEDVLLRAVYDKVENTLSFYQSDLESTAAASTNGFRTGIRRSIHIFGKDGHFNPILCAAYAIKKNRVGIGCCAFLRHPRIVFGKVFN